MARANRMEEEAPDLNLSQERNRKADVYTDD